MKAVASLCLLLMALALPALAQGTEQALIEGQYDASGAQELEDLSRAAQGIEPSFSFRDAATGLAQGKFPVTAQGLLGAALSLLTREVSSCAAGGAQIIFAAILLGLLSHFSLAEKGVFDAAFYVCYAVILGLSLRVFIDAAEVGRRAVQDMSLFMKSAVPVMAVLSISAGNPARAAMSALQLQGVQIASWVVEVLFLPVSYITAALIAAGNVSADFSLKGFADLAKKVASWGIGFVLTVFSGILVAQGMVASAMDNAAGKAAKYAVGHFIPFVGGILSDSLDTVIACGGVLKNAVGVAGMAAIALICLAPAVKLGAMVIILRVSGALAGMVSDGRLSGVINDFAGLLGLIEAMLLGVTLMFIVALAVMVGGAAGMAGI